MLDPSSNNAIDNDGAPDRLALALSEIDSLKENALGNDDAKTDIKLDIKPESLNAKKEIELTKIEVNVKDGRANEIIMDLAQHKETGCGVPATARKWKSEGKTAQEAAAQGKRVASGLVCSHCNPVLDSEY